MAFLPSLHWLLVDGATVLTSPASPVRVLQPQYLKNSNGLPSGLIVVDKERGPVLPSVDVLSMGIVIIDSYLADEDFFGFIPPQAWAWKDMVLGVTVNEHQTTKGIVQRAFVELGIYFIFLLMKNEKDFRSGVFEIQYAGWSVCDIILFSTGAHGLKTQFNFAQTTQLTPPPSPIAGNTTNSLKFLANTLGDISALKVYISPFEAFQPLDRLDMLIGVLDMLVTVAQPPDDQRVQSHTENTVSGVRTSINPVMHLILPNVMTYEQLIFAASVVLDCVTDPRSEKWCSNAIRLQLQLHDHYVGDITMVPSNSSAATSLLRGGNIDGSTGTATSRKKRSIA